MLDHASDPLETETSHEASKLPDDPSQEKSNEPKSLVGGSAPGMSEIQGLVGDNTSSTESCPKTKPTNMKGFNII